MFEEILEYQLPDGRLVLVSSKWIIDETHPLADKEGRVFIARSNDHIDVTGATLLSPGSIKTMSAEAEAQYKLDDEATMNAWIESRAQEVKEAQEALLKSGLPMSAINAILVLQGLPTIGE